LVSTGFFYDESIDYLIDGDIDLFDIEGAPEAHASIFLFFAVGLVSTDLDVFNYYLS